MSDTPSNTPSGAGSAAAKAQELKDAIRKLDFRDRVVFLGSAALVILFFLPWWRISVEMMGMSKSINGLHDAGWVGFIAACLGTTAGLANMGFVPLSGDLKGYAGNTTVQVGLAAAALLLGPLYFWSQLEDVQMFGAGSAGKTLFFWLALLCAGAAAGCAGWKLADERKRMGPAA